VKGGQGSKKPGFADRSSDLLLDLNRSVKPGRHGFGKKKKKPSETVIVPNLSF